ncbi:hypothetical protein [Hoeflea poritis]|uniref:Transposase IS200-like domain-containing protein n=1 Tax=Hoeflea poritis TaxID=2993659 RepID=A0ABT4VPU5_9HYPH|nr:hypothetical protein [Hoeflea poritis]MDA4846732.1 hypothetical protein [Hoeflea poritis]
MARIAHLYIPGLPHHVTQRGNRREGTFFEDGDYALYLDLLAESSARARAEVWTYCPMPNLVHIILVPSDKDAYAGHSPICIVDTPVSSTRENGSLVICGKDVAHRW